MTQVPFKEIETISISMKPSVPRTELWKSRQFRGDNARITVCQNEDSIHVSEDETGKEEKEEARGKQI